MTTKVMHDCLDGDGFTRPDFVYCPACAEEKRMATTTQPPPDTGGEWRWTYDPMPSHPQSYHIREPGNGDCIAHAMTERHAAQMVADHAAVPKLVAALVKARNDAQVFTGAMYLDTAKDGLREIVREIDAALAAVAAGEGGEGGEGHDCIDIDNNLTGKECRACRREAGAGQ